MLQKLLGLKINQSEQISVCLQTIPEGVTKRLWEMLLDRGKQAREQREFERAIFLFETAGQVAVKLNDQISQALAIYYSGLA
ncbi:MAG: hypothetical protein ACRD4L_11020, partial [Pyrinomonadaceae bacterium]